MANAGISSVGSDVYADVAPGAHSTNAHDLVNQATDPRSGYIDTRLLAAQIVDASRQDFDAASRAFAEIEAVLSDRSPADAARFSQDVGSLASNAAQGPSGLWGAGQAWASEGRALLVENPILTKQWESTVSAWTGRGGFTDGFRNVLERHGIQVSPQVNAIPPGSLAANGGVPSAQANNINGSLARDAIADRYRAQGLDVAIEQPRLGGARVVDVVVDVPAADPRYSQRLDIESKVGRVSNSPDLRAQVALDAAELDANRALRSSGHLLEGAGRIARPLGIVLDGIEVAQAFRADGNRIGDNTGRAVSGVAGGAAGGYGGAVAGAAIGTAILPGVGTVVGGIVGGIAGAWGGNEAGHGIFDTVSGWFN